MKFFKVLLLLLMGQSAFSQSTPGKNNVNQKRWPAECRKVEIVSSADQTM